MSRFLARTTLGAVNSLAGPAGARTEIYSIRAFGLRVIFHATRPTAWVGDAVPPEMGFDR